MSVSVYLDTDEELNEERAREILQTSGATTFEAAKFGFSARFPQSAMPVYFRNPPRAEPLPLLQETVGCKWQMRCSVIFTLVFSNHERCYSEIVEVVSRLIETTAACFVLSLEREQALALRDADSGVKYFKNHWPELPEVLEKLP